MPSLLQFILLSVCLSDRVGPLMLDDQPTSSLLDASYNIILQVQRTVSRKIMNGMTISQPTNRFLLDKRTANISYVFSMMENIGCRGKLNVACVCCCIKQWASQWVLCMVKTDNTALNPLIKSVSEDIPNGHPGCVHRERSTITVDSKIRLQMVQFIVLINCVMQTSALFTQNNAQVSFH